jgi:hypothetical protein
VSPHLRGHLLLFDPRPVPMHSQSAGARLLITAVFVEVVRLVAVRWRYPLIPLWLLLPALLGLALWAVAGIAGVKLSHLGFRRWRDWTTTEKSYFVQVVVIANLVFPIVLGAQIKNRVAQPGLASSLWTVFVPYLFFGFYQELVYRGMVQLELIRRWRAPQASSSRICCTRSDHCTGTTLGRAHPSRGQCSQPSSRSDCSSASYTDDPGISGWLPSSTRLEMPTSSGAWIGAYD